MKRNKKRIIIKLTLSIIYIMVICILMFSAFRIHEEETETLHWSEVSSIDEYAYLTIGEMSKPFAEIEDKSIHFVIENKEDETWRISLIAIDQEDSAKFEKIIDYSYERLEERPDPVRVYGYPVAISQSLRELAIENIIYFIPYERRFELNEDNFEEYFSNVYLDTTIEEKEELNPIISLLVAMTIILVLLLIFTIFNKDRLVDEVDNFLEI